MTKKEEKKLLKKLEKECKSLCSRITQYLWDDTCAMCGKAGSNAHHFFGWKACSAVRFVLDNLVWLCYACHIHKVHQQGLTEPIRAKIIERIGQEQFDRMYLQAFSVCEYTVEGLEKRKAELLDIIEENKI